MGALLKETNSALKRVIFAHYMIRQSVSATRIFYKDTQLTASRITQSEQAIAHNNLKLNLIQPMLPSLLLLRCFGLFLARQSTFFFCSMIVLKFLHLTAAARFMCCYCDSSVQNGKLHSSNSCTLYASACFIEQFFTESMWVWLCPMEMAQLMKLVGDGVKQ